MKENQILAYLHREAAEFNIDEFLVMIGREELLSQEEELQLIAQALQDDDEAMQRLLNANMRFVVSLANQYKRDGFTLQKLIQVGVMGLEQAIKTYDLASDQKLIRVSVPVMRKFLVEFVNNNQNIDEEAINKPSDYDIHYHRYTLEFKFIPELIDRVNEEDWDVKVLTDKEWWRERLEEFEKDFYFDWDEFTMERRRLEDGNQLIVYHFPCPMQVPEALYGLVIVDVVKEKVTYYTLECAHDGDWCICKPTTEAHCNHGFVDTDDLQSFIDGVMEWYK